jgi:hypothetical protein
MIRTAAPLLLLSALVMPGCHHGSSNGITQSQQVQYGNAAESANNLIMDAALSALVLQATSANPPADPVRTTGALKRRDPLAGRADLTRLANGAFVVGFDQLLDINGAKLFPALTGAFTITPSGTAVSSWPTGSNQQALGAATIVFDQGPINYTDPGDGLSVTISLGSFTIATATTYQYTSLMNWTMTVDAQLSITQNNELTWTANPANQPTHVVTLYGYRHVNLMETRTSNGSVNQLMIVRSVDGNGNPGNPPGGQTGIDPQAPSAYLTNFIHVIDLIQPDAVSDEWYRLETTTTTWDYTQAPAAKTQTIGAQQIMVTRDGATAGPYNNASLLAAFSTQASN